MADKFVARWGRSVEDTGYVMAPFLAMQIAPEGTTLAVLACCYKYTWAGPFFTINTSEWAEKFGVGRQCVYRQFLKLEKKGLIQIDKTTPGEGITVDFSPFIATVNEIADDNAAAKTEVKQAKLQKGMNDCCPQATVLLPTGNSENDPLCPASNSLLPASNKSRIHSINRKRTLEEEEGLAQSASLFPDLSTPISETKPPPKPKPVSIWRAVTGVSLKPGPRATITAFYDELNDPEKFESLLRRAFGSGIFKNPANVDGFVDWARKGGVVQTKSNGKTRSCSNYSEAELAAVRKADENKEWPDPETYLSRVQQSSHDEAKRSEWPQAP